MSIVEKFNNISEVMTNLIEFVQSDEDIKVDFEEYLLTMGYGGGKNISAAQMQSICLPYIFERNFNSKSIIEHFLDKAKKITKPVRTILKGLLNSVSSIFEVKKVMKNGFSLYNLVNEKDYDVISLVKMTHYRGVGPGQFVVARVFEFEGDYYLLEISSVLAASQKDDAMRYAIAKIIQSPEIVYKDNKEKEKQIKAQVKKMSKKFVECFESNEVITTNKFADDLISLFNDYAETGTSIEQKLLDERIIETENPRFFEVKEFNNTYDNFLENSLDGFSSHSEIYDVGIVFDEELGLSAVPFYSTFSKIFEKATKGEDYKDIPNYDKCIEHFLINDSISANLLTIVHDKFDKFMDVINEVYETTMTFDELLEKYKSQHLKEKIYSSTTVLYESNTFSKTLGYIEDESSKPDIDTTDVGRNDPCPCGSGKKFKKCCLMQHA